MTSEQQVSTAVVPVNEVVEQDSKVVELWLYDKAKRTQANYRNALKGLLQYPMRSVTLGDMRIAVEQQPERSQSIAVTAIKSLWSFSQKLGYIQVNSSTMLHAPKQRDRLVERIMSEENVLRMLDRTVNKRDHAMIRLLYHAGLRVAELCNLKWSDINEYDDFAVMGIFGKGQKLRHVRISGSMYLEMVEQAGTGVIGS